MLHSKINRNPIIFQSAHNDRNQMSTRAETILHFEIVGMKDGNSMNRLSTAENGYYPDNLLFGGLQTDDFSWTDLQFSVLTRGVISRMSGAQSFKEDVDCHL